MIRGTIAGAAAAILAASLAAAAPAAATVHLCGWTGDVDVLMSKADRQVSSINLDRLVRKEYGAKAAVTRVSPLEVELLAPSSASVAPTDASGLIDNVVSYRVIVSTPGRDKTSARLQLLYRGLCYRSVDFAAITQIGSLGVESPRISADKALRLAQDFRRGHSDRFPLDNPLVGLQLMRATSAPPDFGVLRWFVTYQSAPGLEQVLAVHMNGKVRIVVP
ncbi:MAG: hypothetical protein ACKO70_08020 [Actinomycetota bacterium]